MSLLLELPKLPSRSGAHGNARHAHWAQRARTVREEQYAWACLLMVALDQLGLWGSATRQAEWHFLSARVDVTFVFRMDRRRDRDNYAAALKPLWDAVVQVGILPDDDSEHLSIGGLVASCIIRSTHSPPDSFVNSTCDCLRQGHLKHPTGFWLAFARTKFIAQRTKRAVDSILNNVL